MHSQILNRNNSRNAALAIIAIAAFLSSPLAIHAASLSFSPSTSNLSAGNIVSVKALVSTDGESVNNANATIRFPADMLEVISVTKGSSIFPLWVEEPSFSNSEGSISFNGGVPNPGVVGQGKEIVLIAFRAKKQGDATLLFSDSAVRANDGLGTNILSSTQSASIRITGPAQSDVPAPAAASDSVPKRPVVTSSTHPLQESWYPASSATFGWVVPAGVTSVQTLLSVNPTAVPSITYDSSVSQRTVANLDDGVLYFHIRYMSSAGWGPIARYKIQIDSTAPEKLSASVSSVDGRDMLSLAASDSQSGISHYSIAIDGASFRVEPADVASGAYTLPALEKGSRDLVVTAHDKAGNRAEKQLSFMSSGPVAPIITASPAVLTRGESLTVKGTARYPYADVDVLIAVGGKAPVSYQVKALADGSFSFVSDDVGGTGNASVSARMSFPGDIKSPSSNVISFQIRDTEAVRFGKSTVRLLMVLIPAIILFLLLLLALYLGWHKFFGLKRKLAREAGELSKEIHDALMLLRSEMTAQMRKLEDAKKDRDLNRKEEKILRDLQDNIDSVDAFVTKKILKMK
jgi:hypothetical protein